MLLNGFLRFLMQCPGTSIKEVDKIFSIINNLVIEKVNSKNEVLDDKELS